MTAENYCITVDYHALHNKCL